MVWEKQTVFTAANNACDANHVILLTMCVILSYNCLGLAESWHCTRWIAAACGVQAGKVRGSWEPRRQRCALLQPFQSTAVIYT